MNTKWYSKVNNFNGNVDLMQNQMSFLWLWWVKLTCHYH